MRSARPLARVRTDLGLALRLIRGAPARTLLFIACLAVGVAARVAVGSLASAADDALAREARPLLGGDLVVESNHALTPAVRAELDAALPAGSRVARERGFVAMASAGAASRLVEVRAVDAAWPAVGTTVFAAALPGVADPAAAFAGRDGLPGVAAAPGLAAALGVTVGDHVRLGRQEFVLAALLAEDPGTEAFALGPRILVALDAVAATGLDAAGSRVRDRTLIALPSAAGAEAAAAVLAARWRLEPGESGWGQRGPGERDLAVRTARQSQGGLERAFGRVEDFLRLLALAALLLAAIGAGALARAHVLGRLDTAAMLAVLGAGPGRVVRIAVLQVLTLALAGASVGAALGLGAQVAVLMAMAGRTPIPLAPSFDAAAIGWGIAIGVVVALAAAAAPLVALRRLPPLGVLRGEAPDLRAGAAGWLVGAFGVAAVAAVAAADARSWRDGLTFTGALVVAGALLQVVGVGLLRALAAWRPGSPGLRHGLANLARPGLRAGAAVTALGLATAVIAALAVQRAAVGRVLDTGAQQRPGLFVIDLQDEDLDAFAAAVTDATGEPPIAVSPMVPARWRQEAPAEAARSHEEQQARFFRNREQRLSWRAAPGPGEELIAGRWPIDDPSQPEHAEVAVEERWAERVGVAVGDTLRFDVQGIEVAATVVGLRRINWLELTPNFFIQFNPGALAGAPRTWVAAVRDPGDDARRALQARLAREFPLATAFDIAAVVALARRISAAILDALRLIGWFALAAGLVAVAGVCLAGARERTADIALLRALGARDRTLRAAQLAEFGAIGLVAGGLGIAAAVGIAQVLSFGRMPLDLTPPWRELAVIAAAVTTLSALAGLLAARPALRAPPLVVLRGE